MTLPRAIFFGTPEFAVPCLDALTRIASVVRVVCQPDRPAGRGHREQAPPVKVRALELGIEVMQPRKVKPPELAAELAALDAQIGVVVAYGRILPRHLLDAPARGCVNVHGSLLPRWRGAAPIQWAIASGDAESGVCLMQMDEGLDTGAVISCARTPIGADETSGELFARLSTLGSELLERDLPRYLSGELGLTPQDDAAATHARMLDKSDARLDPGWDARRVHDHARGMHPWPGASLWLRGSRVKVHATRLAQAEGTLGAPGEVLAIDGDGIRIACGSGALLLRELQLEGRKRLPGDVVAAGLRLETGERFEAPPQAS